MRVCFISVEIFAWGKYGGFGKATRSLGRELAKRGIDAWAIVPQRAGQKRFEELDGIKILSFPPHKPSRVFELARECNADIYHSQEPSLSTYYAKKAMPDRIHFITLRDTRTLEDWLIELKHPSLHYAQVVGNWIFEDNFLVRKSVREANRCFVPAKDLSHKSRKKYRLVAEPTFLPTPIHVPEDVCKAETPTVCFLGRLDRRKRPDLFLDLVADFPKTTFLVAGDARNKRYGEFLKRQYQHLPNLEFRGFVDPYDETGLQEILGQSWILVNTSEREGLPTSFLEALAHRTALLSSIPTDGLCESFGYYAADRNYKKGLAFLLENNRWKDCGERGYQYVRDIFTTPTSVSLHIDAYSQALA